MEKLSVKTEKTTKGTIYISLEEDFLTHLSIFGLDGLKISNS
jgi:hypothetical protein